MFQPLSSILPQRLASHKIAQPVAAASLGEEIMSAVESLCGELYRRHARFLYIKENVATLATLRPAVSQEIHLRGSEICARVNQRLGRMVLKRVRLLQ